MTAVSTKPKAAELQPCQGGPHSPPECACTHGPSQGGMEPRPTHLAAWSSSVEASTVTVCWVHTLAPVEAGEQVCKGDTEAPPHRAETPELRDEAPPSCQGSRPYPSQYYMKFRHPRQFQHSSAANLNEDTSMVPQNWEENTERSWRVGLENGKESPCREKRSQES